jgi:hypothetical protein
MWLCVITAGDAVASERREDPELRKQSADDATNGLLPLMQTNSPKRDRNDGMSA